MRILYEFMGLRLYQLAASGNFVCRKGCFEGRIRNSLGLSLDLRP